jgi:hypothetical protein
MMATNRRRTISSPSFSFPLNRNSSVSQGNGEIGNHMATGNSWSRFCKTLFLVLVALTMMLAFMVQQKSSTNIRIIPSNNSPTINHHQFVREDTTSKKDTVERQVQEENEITTDVMDELSQFPSLQYALSNSFLVGLYFAASWCPMSTPVTNLLDELFRDILVKPTGDSLTGGLSIVYVSSDQTQEQFDHYIKPNWMSVPFENVQERSDLKRHFTTCAKREMEELGMQTRDREIPSLIILAADTRQVLTYSGVQDIKERGVAAIDHWLEMKRLAEALEQKFDVHEEHLQQDMIKNNNLASIVQA